MTPQDSKAISNADKARLDAINEAWKAYNGQFKDPLIVKGNFNDNVIVNRCAPIVDTGITFLFGQVVKIEVQDGTTDQQNICDSIWGDDDDKMTLLSKLAHNGAVAGNAFVKIIPPDVTDNGLPRLVVIDPSYVMVATDPDDVETVMQWIIQYDTQDAQGTLTKRQEITRIDPDNDADLNGGMDTDSTWQITNWTKRGDSNTWQQIGDAVTWPYNWSPLRGCQNLPEPNDYYGRADLTSDIIHLNKSLNFIDSNTNRIIRYHAHPKTWVRGMAARDLDVSVDNVIGVPSETATLQNLEMHSDLASSMNFAASIRSDMDEQSRVPAVAVGRVAELPRTTSGVALSMLYGPLMAKTVVKRRLYGKLIREVTACCMVLMGQANTPDDVDIELHWESPLPSDDLAEAQTALAWQQIGVSNDTLMRRGGFDPDAEMSKSLDEDQQKMQAYMRGQGAAPMVDSAPPQAQLPPPQQQAATPPQFEGKQ